MLAPVLGLRPLFRPAMASSKTAKFSDFELLPRSQVLFNPVRDQIHSLYNLQFSQGWALLGNLVDQL
jgi:hypothetical protein